MELSGWPGATMTGALTRPLPTLISIMSSSSRFHLVSVAPETIAALSQLRFVTGLGSSCSQPTLAQRPWYTFGSGRKMTSIESFDVGVGTAPLNAPTLD